MFLAKKGLCIYGNDAYMNSPFMATPFKAVSSGVKDAYNFYHSKLRINVECSFGMLVNQWAVLKAPIPLNISIKKQQHWLDCYAAFINFL